MTRGLPGSGKSRWAKDQVQQSTGGYVRVNKDDLRAMLHEGKWSRSNEKLILAVRDQVIVSALQSGNHVIVDDTNFAPKHEERLRQLAKENSAAFEVEDFTAVPLDTCIERDLKRLASVGEKVIRKMHADYLAPKPPVVEHDPMLPDCIICDIDGTVALMNGRGPYEEDKVDTDKPNVPVVGLVRQLQATGDKIIFVSGRHERVREKTAKWLQDNVMWISDPPVLFMRPDEDNRHDHIIKTEIYEREFRGKYNVRFVLDDRDRVVEKAWRSLGLPCFQVAPGDF
jgi:predicted kinase